MTVLWSPGGPQLKKPGGIFWRVVSFMHSVAQMQKLTTSITSTYANNGVLSAAMKPLTSAINGTMLPSGAIADTMKPPTTAVTASQMIPGSIADTMLKPLTAVQVAQIDSGTIADTMSPLSTSVAGLDSNAGTVAATIGGIPSSSVNAAEYPRGSIADTIAGPLSSAVAAAEAPQGAIATALKLAATAITGGQTQGGTIADVMTQASTVLAGTQYQIGSMAATLQQAITAINSTYVSAAQQCVGAWSANGATVNFSGVLANDLIFVWSFRDGSATALATPAGYTNIFGAAGASDYGRLDWKVASGSETTVTVTNSSETAVGVWRGFSGPGNISSSVATVASPSYAEISPLEVAGGSSWVAAFAAHRSVGGSSLPAPTGMTQRVGTPATPTSSIAIDDTNNGVTSWAANGGGSAPTTGLVSSGAITVCVELLSTAGPNINYWKTPGTYTTFTVPASGTVDLVAIGGGGAGSAGGSFNGLPGSPGSWATATSLVIGTNIKPGTTVTVVIPAQAVGPSSGNGPNGGNTTIQYVDMSNVTQTVTATGGAGGIGQDSTSGQQGAGVSPATQTINGVTYTGGGQSLNSSGSSASHTSNPSADGITPGGGGGGLCTSGNAGYGGIGGAWVTVQ
jgi:hypothetical protein